MTDLSELMKPFHIDHLRLTLGLMTFMLLGTGCSYLPKLPPSYDPPAPVQRELPAPSSGAIYQSGGETRLFEDLKAGRVGDILTVRLLEQTNASLQSNTRTSKTTETTLVNPIAFSRSMTRNGDPMFGASLDGEQAFDGAGSSSQSNSLTGDITVTVVERFANGNMRIRGEKQVMINQGKEYIRLSGIIRAYDIGPNNSISSQKIADAQITYSSKGVIAAANRMGLFSRFFHSIFYPY